jgi:hypothetical protein
MGALELRDVVPNLASSDLVEDGAVKELDPTRSFKLLAWDRLGGLIIASRRALFRAALDQPVWAAMLSVPSSYTQPRSANGAQYVSSM